MTSRAGWTIEKATDLALSCETRADFRRRHHGAYKWAYRNGLLDRVCEHMPPKFCWTLETVAAEAAQYNTRAEFMAGNSSAYQWWTRNGKPAGVCDHMELQKRRLSEAQVREDALRYESRNAFCLGHQGSYKWAIAHGILDDVCSHMKLLNAPVTLEEARAAASEHETRSAFQNHCPRCYAWAFRAGVLDEICAHMKPGDNVSDYNVVYLLAPEGMPFVRKVGVTSRRSGRSRVRAIEKSLGAKCKATLVPRDDALSVEREVLRMGKSVDLPPTVEGRTEFRRFTDAELIAAAEMIGVPA